MSVEYKSWEMSSPYDNDCLTPEDIGYIHKDDLPNLDDAREFIKGIKEALYETGNVAQIEGMLEELCYQFDVEITVKEPLIELKNKNRLMHWYLGYQRAHIDQMNNNNVR